MLLNLNTVPNLDSKQSLIFLLRHGCEERHGSEDRTPTACGLIQISWQKTHTQVKKWLETSVSLPSTTDSTVAMTWQKNWRTISIIIWCKFLILFIGQGPIMWPTNNCLQIMLRSWAMSSYCVSLQIILCSCVNETTLFSCLRLLLRDNGTLLRFPKIFIKKQTWWSNDYWTTQ